MANSFTRRRFVQAAGLASTIPVWAQKKRDLNIGHTGITWVQAPPPRPPAPPPSADGAAPAAPPAGRGGGGPRGIDPVYIEGIFKDISSLGFYGVELFSNQITGMEEHGGLLPLIEKYKLPLISAYGGPNLTDATKRKENIADAIAWGKIFKKNGGKVVVIGPSGRGRDYVFKDHKDDIVATLNEYGKQLMDIGLTGCVHQHTGTCIETRDETYAIMESVDTKYVRFGPDVGQLQKGGSDPVQVVKDFRQIIDHMHLKDFNGGQTFVGYCPLGQGKVDLPAILDLMDGKKTAGLVMVELDGDRRAPMTALETATIARDYLQKQGVQFRKV